MGGSREGITDLDLGAIRPAKRHVWMNTVRVGARVAWSSLKLLVALTLPFLVLVRVSVYTHQNLGWGTWVSLATGVCASALPFTIYALVLWKTTIGGSRVPRLAVRLLLVVVGCYTVYGLLYRSTAGAENPELREYRASLHPLVRIGAVALLPFDRDAVVTDLGRNAEDYLKMGLPVREMSLHFKLQDRFIRALDLRTAGRTERRNRLTEGYLRFMGFRTLRLVGTADHLHVSLPMRGT